VLFSVIVTVMFSDGWAVAKSPVGKLTFILLSKFKNVVVNIKNINKRKTTSIKGVKLKPALFLFG